MKHVLNILRPALLVAMLSTAMVFPIIGNASADSFDMNRIMDDEVFNNSGTLAVGNINAFLNSFGQSCISPNNGFSSPDPTGYTPTAGFTYGPNVSAGQVISDASQAYGLNPEVLLATLQKESSVVTGTASYGCQYINTAMGYGCPDGGSCPTDPATMSGFSKQVIHAAWLLKFGQERALGNTGWNIQLTNYPQNGDVWDNSDDPATCYGGPMTQGLLSRGCGQSATYYDGYTTIDGTAVHMDTGATSALYWYTPHFAGNENFFNIFSSWFGSTTVPRAFKTPGSGTVYVQASGYKFSVPSMAMLQDYGISPGSIQTVSQADADAIPAPDGSTGLSSSLGYVVKSPSDTDADGGAVYLISVGKIYSFSSMQQLSDFGFTTSDINYLPLNYIYSLQLGGGLSDFISTPSSNAFQVSGGIKRIIFDGATYSSLNPSNNASFLSDGTASLIPSGQPITNREILVGNTSGTIYLLDNGTYYSLPSLDVYNCWGFSGPLGTPLYRLANDSYIGSVGSPAGLGCTYNTDASTTYTLDGSNKILIPSSYGISASIPNQDLLNLISKLPARGSNLNVAVKSGDSGTIWYLENSDLKRPIPSLADFNLLGLNLNQVDTISSDTLSSIPSGPNKIATGQVVKTDSSGAVFVTTSDNSRLVFSSGDDFVSHGYSWSSIESFPASSLDSSYPATTGSVSSYLYDQASDSVYLLGLNGCYSLNSSQLTSFGQSKSAVQSAQTYQSTIFPYVSLGSCKPVSLYVKYSSQGTVYWVDGGQKHPFSSWQALVSFSGQSSPDVITLSQTTLDALPTGSAP